MMEKIQGQTKLGSLDENRGSVEDQSFFTEEEQFSTRSFQDTKIPFPQMLQQSEDSCSFLSFKDQNLLALISHEGPELPLKPLDRCKSKKLATSSSMTREKRKRRRRTKPTKNIEEIESQRMTHIAVERNRRHQMNLHLNSLRSLIPSHYIQRGDQASIVGGAIDFVKILEEQLQLLEAHKNNLVDISSNKLKVDVTVIESHVNLKIQCLRKQGQLVRSIMLLEKLRFSVLHLNITSPSKTSISYSFNLKMEDDCSLRSADEITAAIRQIFE